MCIRIHKCIYRGSELFLKLRWDFTALEIYLIRRESPPTHRLWASPRDIFKGPPTKHSVADDVTALVICSVGAHDVRELDDS
jgi:hypothetical protein